METSDRKHSFVTLVRALERRARVYLYRKEGLRRLMRPFVAVPSGRKWVFILGCYGSGTTLLHDLIANSQDCASLPGEGAFFTSHLITPEELGWTRLWWKVYDQMKAYGEGGGRKAEVVKKDWCIWYDVKRPVFLEKSISNAVRIPWLVKNFRNALFIHVIRNGYAVAEGIRRRGGNSTYSLPAELAEYPIEWCAQQWVISNIVIEQELRRINGNPVLTITYEDLCEQPHEWLARIGSFTGLVDLTRQDVAYIQNKNPQSINNLRRVDIIKINDIASELLTRYGYDIL